MRNESAILENDSTPTNNLEKVASINVRFDDGTFSRFLFLHFALPG